MASVAAVYSFSSGEVTPLLSGRKDMPSYMNSCKQLINFFTLVYGGVQRRSGTRFINKTKYPDRATRLIPFVYSEDNAYILEFGDKYIRFHDENGTLMNGDVPYEISSPYSQSRLSKINFAQSGDSIYFVHKDVNPYKLTRIDDLNWSMAEIKFVNPYKIKNRPEAIFYPHQDTNEDAINTWREYAITLVDVNGRESEISLSVRVKTTSFLDVDNYVQIRQTEAIGQVPVTFEVEWMFVYRKENGVWAYLGRTPYDQYIIQEPGGSPVYNGRFIDDGTYTPDLSRNPPKYKSFNTAGNRPMTVTFDSQRLVFGGTINDPNKIWGSAINNFEDFSERGDNTATSSYEYMLSTRNDIRWMHSVNSLLIGTAGNEVAASADDGGSISALSINAKNQSNVGTNGVSVADSIGVIFTSRTGRDVQNISYALTNNGFIPVSLLIYAEHLTRNRVITEMAKTETPENIIWCLTDDGIALTLTYNQNHEVIAWSRQITEGKFKSIGTIPGVGRDIVFFVVERGGEQYIELLEDQFRGDLNTSFFVDCGLRYDGDPIRAISGLEHLEGRTVSVCTNGSAHPNRVVTDGQITLQAPYEHVVVGLPYESLLETNELAYNFRYESTSPKKMAIREISIRVENSVGGTLSIYDADTKQEREYKITTRHTHSRGVEPFTGYDTMPCDSGYAIRPTIIGRQAQPLPMTILELAPRIEVTGD